MNERASFDSPECPYCFKIIHIEKNVEVDAGYTTTSCHYCGQCFYVSARTIQVIKYTSKQLQCIICKKDQLDFDHLDCLKEELKRLQELLNGQS